MDLGLQHFKVLEDRIVFLHLGLERRNREQDSFKIAFSLIFVIQYCLTGTTGRVVLNVCPDGHLLIDKVRWLHCLLFFSRSAHSR